MQPNFRPNHVETHLFGSYFERPCDQEPFPQTSYDIVLYTNIDLKLRNKLHGPMHYKIGVTCVYNGHVCYTLL